MNNHFASRTLFLLLSFILIFNPSCNKLTEDPSVANALVGFWRFNNASVDVTVAGVDFVDYAMAEFGLTEEEAQTVLDEILDDVLEIPGGEIEIDGDRTYHQYPNTQYEKNGEWSVSADGEIFTMFFDDVENQFTILKLAAKSCELQLPIQTETIDIDGNETAETVIDIDTKVQLTKVIGGAVS